MHIDLDVLDSDIVGSVGVPEPKGLSAHRLADAVRALGERFTIAGIGITEHQPTADGPTGTDDAAVLKQLARTLIDIVAGSAPEDVQRIEQHAINAWPAPITQTPRRLAGAPHTGHAAASLRQHRPAAVLQR